VLDAPDQDFEKSGDVALAVVAQMWRAFENHCAKMGGQGVHCDWRPNTDPGYYLARW